MNRAKRAFWKRWTAVRGSHRDAKLEAAYREWAKADREGQLFRTGARAAADEIWRKS
jgi:hypothetical protein